MMKTIGITGRAGSGKDTLARFICDKHRFIHLGFAAPIRDFVASLFGLTSLDIARGELKERPCPELFGYSPRQLMQSVGTEWGRKIHPDFWVQVALKEIHYLEEHMSYGGVVISDVRFDNEAHMIKSRGGTIIQLVRNGVEPVNPHVSEAGISPDLIDLTIPNNGTLRGLQEKAEDIVF